MNINKAVAMRVSQLALEKNMSPYALEQKAMIPHSTLFNILAENHADVRFSTIYRLAFAFDMDILEFLNDDVFKNVDILKELG